jgi:hypothetical protein
MAISSDMESCSSSRAVLRDEEINARSVNGYTKKWVYLWAEFRDRTRNGRRNRRLSSRSCFRGQLQIANRFSPPGMLLPELLVEGAVADLDLGVLEQLRIEGVDPLAHEPIRQALA